jgi:hypothetical protein
LEETPLISVNHQFGSNILLNDENYAATLPAAEWVKSPNVRPVSLALQATQHAQDI